MNPKNMLNLPIPNLAKVSKVTPSNYVKSNFEQAKLVIKDLTNLKFPNFIYFENFELL